MKQPYQYLLRLTPYFFWGLTAAVTYFMLIELAPKQDGWPYLDKIQHGLVFFVLTIVGGLAFFKKKNWVYLGLAIFGAITEWAQSAFTITRLGSIQDWFADVFGILLAILILWILRRFISECLVEIR